MPSGSATAPGGGANAARVAASSAWRQRETQNAGVRRGAVATRASSPWRVITMTPAAVTTVAGTMAYGMA